MTICKPIPILSKVAFGEHPAAIVSPKQDTNYRVYKTQRKTMISDSVFCFEVSALPNTLDIFIRP